MRSTCLSGFHRIALALANFVDLFRLLLGDDLRPCRWKRTPMIVSVISHYRGAALLAGKLKAAYRKRR
jgi:hypothetical protein